ncbi:hypothetical protein DPEC_G00313910 [Dallia pectoralis]|uniref:Uncharacterized protein n=1 Tax=Dallia pectoralis TaxID=75939 RepID=A0ACC2FC77_DALPE|nr:hypothetical protein DPEC_G00313910 [Dallia pectoralis]
MRLLSPRLHMALDLRGFSQRNITNAIGYSLEVALVADWVLISKHPDNLRSITALVGWIRMSLKWATCALAETRLPANRIAAAMELQILGLSYSDFELKPRSYDISGRSVLRSDRLLLVEVFFCLVPPRRLSSVQAGDGDGESRFPHNMASRVWDHTPSSSREQPQDLTSAPPSRPPPHPHHSSTWCLALQPSSWIVILRGWNSDLTTGAGSCVCLVRYRRYERTRRFLRRCMEAARGVNNRLLVVL